ncbi:hypothetical protein [Lysobacter sp. Hz 25]|uniref:hypothetical protein n=1 Tax=Lysobacter sp. Hz 25 TaxID=3383698 RepID=UPI0038D47F2E
MVDFQANALVAKGADLRQVASQVKQAIERAGYRIESEESMSSGNVEITFLPDRASRDAWYAITAVVANTSGVPAVGLRSLGDSELKQQSTPQMRSFMCGFLDDLPSVKANTQQVAQQEAGIYRGAAPSPKKKGREIRPKAELDFWPKGANVRQRGSRPIESGR